MAIYDNWCNAQLLPVQLALGGAHRALLTTLTTA